MVKNLRLLRERAGISQEKLGEIIGYSQQTVNNYENHGIEPDLQTLELLADYFQTSVDFLIGHSPKNNGTDPDFSYTLNADERQVMDLYRRLSREEKKSIRLVMENYLRK